MALHARKEGGCLGILARPFCRNVLAELHPGNPALDAELLHDRRRRRIVHRADGDVETRFRQVIAERERSAAVPAIGALGKVGTGEHARFAAVHAKALFGAPASAANSPPVARWHLRQWQTRAFSGAT